LFPLSKSINGKEYPIGNETNLRYPEVRRQESRLTTKDTEATKTKYDEYTDCLESVSWAELAVAGFLVLFESSGDTGAAKFVGIIFAEEHIPLLAAFENFLFLRGDALANLLLEFFFIAEDVGDGLDHVLTDGVAVLDEFHFIALHQKIDDLVRDANDFFAGQSHFLFRLGSLP
jgi:hypothetical protein